MTELLAWVQLARSLFNLLAFFSCLLVVWYMHRRIHRMRRRGQLAALRFSRFIQIAFAAAIPYSLAISWVTFTQSYMPAGVLTQTQINNILLVSPADILRCIGKIAFAAHLMGFLFPMPDEEHEA